MRKTRKHRCAPDGSLPPKAAAIRRNDELRELCADVDRAPEHQGRDKEALERRIVAKFDAFDKWSGRHGFQLTDRAKAVVAPSEILEAIGHAGHPVSKALRMRAYRIALEHGLKERPLRHDPPDGVDALIDAYQEVVLGRGKGPPRIALTPTKLSPQGSAEEIGCVPEELDAIRMHRLKLMTGAVLEPGELFDENDGRRRRKPRRSNPAVPVLVAAAIAKADQRFPQHPMRPNEIDLPVFADAAGVSVSDILTSGEARKLIDAAVRKGRLVPNPLLAARVLTWHELQEHGRRARKAAASHHGDPALAGRSAVAALKRFRLMTTGKSGPEDPVPHDLPALVEKAIASKPDSVASGWAKRMRDWVRWAHDARAEKPLPELFASALSVLCAERGMGEQAFLDATPDPGNVKLWLHGQTVPTMRKQAVLEAVESVFDLPKDRLKDLLSAEWRSRRFDLDELLAELEVDMDPRAGRHLPEDFPTWERKKQKAHLLRLNTAVMRQDTEFSRRNSEMTRDRYRLAPDKWPKAMREGWARQQPKPSEGEGMPLPSEQVVPEADDADAGNRKDVWRQGTIDRDEGLLASFFGYLTRPRKLAPEERYAAQSRKTDFRPEAGLGIPVELISPAVFAFPDLVASFSWWRKRRSGARVTTIGQTLHLASEFVRPETGVVWNSPEMIDDMRALKKWWDENPHDLADGPKKLDLRPFKDWTTGVAKAHAVLVANHKRFNKGKLPMTRDPFIVIANFLRKGAKPMEEYMKGVRVLLTSRPHSTISKHVHLRNCALVLILVQTGLRAGTLLLNMSGPNQTIFKETNEQTGEAVWRIRIPAERFKNFDGPYFAEGQPYDFDLADEDDLYAILDRYVSVSRTYMLRGRESDALFVTSRACDLATEQLGLVYRALTRYYFVDNGLPDNGGIKGAMIHGPHAVRHVIASHIVRVTGDLYLAAWAIQDSVKTVERYYARFVPSDKAALAAKVLIEARAAGRGWTRKSATSAKPALPLAA